MAMKKMSFFLLSFATFTMKFCKSSATVIITLQYAAGVEATSSLVFIVLGEHILQDLLPEFLHG
jgi:hypothetical protein